MKSEKSSIECFRIRAGSKIGYVEVWPMFGPWGKFGSSMFEFWGTNRSSVFLVSFQFERTYVVQDGHVQNGDRCEKNDSNVRSMCYLTMTSE